MQLLSNGNTVSVR